jgi:hypothetical protein
MTVISALTPTATSTRPVVTAASALPADLMPPISGAFATSAATSRSRLVEACVAFAHAEGMIDIGAAPQHPPLYDTERGFDDGHICSRRLIIVDENWW